MALTKQCPTCGEKISASVGECLYCPPPDQPSGASATPAVMRDPAGLGVVPATRPAAPDPRAPAAVPAAPKVPSPDGDRAFGLLLFEAEECLARGNVEKAMVHASKAVKERPDHLTARSLYERARRELLRGRRRERLDERVARARDLVGSGDLAGAEKIVGTALKLLPDHPLALELFGRIKDARLHAGTVEAEAEREIERLGASRAQRAVDSARAAMKAGWDFRALMTVRRALAAMPDDPELLSLYTEATEAVETARVERAVRRARMTPVAGLRVPAPAASPVAPPAVAAPVSPAPPEVAAPQPAPTPAPDPVRTWLPSSAGEIEIVMEDEPPPPPIALEDVPPIPPARPRAVAARPPSSASETAAAPSPLPSSAAERTATPPPVPAPRRPATAPVRHAELARPRGSTPWGLILAGAAVPLAILFFFVLRSDDSRPAGTSAAAASPLFAPPAARPAAAPESDPSLSSNDIPFRAHEPDLRRGVESALGAYARALESADAAALARARPDLGETARAALVERFTGAVNAAIDLRVLDVARRGDAVEVTVLRTDVIVGGRAQPTAPVEESLRFVRTGEGWVLRPGH